MKRNFTLKVCKCFILCALLILTSATSFAQLVGGTTYPINGTNNGATSFATLRSAVDYLTTYGVTGTGQVVLEFTAPYVNEDMTSGITIGAFANPTSATLGVTIRPGVGVNVELNSAMVSGYLVTMDGCNYITIDGRQGGTGPIGLSITSTAGRPTVYFGDGTNNAIKYANLKSDVSSATLGNVYISLSGTNGTIANNNIGAYDANVGSANGILNLSTATENYSILNNNISGFTARGIMLSTGTGAGWVVSGNSIYNTKAPTAADPFGVLIEKSTPNVIISDNFIGGDAPLCAGMMPTTSNFNSIKFIPAITNSGVTYTVKGNTIANIESTGAKGIRGVWVVHPDVAATYNIENNKIYNFKNILSTGAVTAIVGLHLESAGNSVVTFNVINNVISFNDANFGTENMYGIYRAKGVKTITNAYFNTVHMGGVSTAANLGNFYLHTNTTTSTHNVKNNVFSNSYLTGIGCTLTPGAGGTLESSDNIIVYDGASTRTDQTFKYGDPGKPASPSDFFHDIVGGVLLVKTPFFNEIDGKAVIGTGALTDIMGKTRSASSPTIGAYEYSATVLPVIIKSFTALPNNNRVTLKWTVGTETNVNRYEVEHSTDGITFTSIATAKASGALDYTARDNNPIIGANYYRLKTIDNDETHSNYGEIKVVKIAALANNSFTIYPNPIKDNQVNFTLPIFPNGPVTYKVVNMAGKLMQTGTIEGTNTTTFTLNLKTTIAKGIYILSVMNGKEVLKSKLVKN